jgi:hypothetical protein
VYESAVWNNYPVELRSKYSAILHTDAADGSDGETFVSEDLCAEVLGDETNFTETQRFMKESYNRNLQRAVHAYIRFQRTEDVGDLTWPNISKTNFELVFKPPSNKLLKKIFDVSFELVFPFLRRDLFCRTPGRLVKWDGTFDFLKKTKDDELAEDDNDCLHIVWGDYGHVLAWAMSAGNENDNCF